MNPVRTVAFTGLLLLVALAGAAPPDPTAEGRKIAMAFGGELKGALQAAMAEGGPVAAVEVCAARAPAIAAEASAASGARVGRTALKIRNPANAPDDHERAVLEEFAERLAREPGSVPETVEALPDGRVRYMRAIVTDGVCVACHGATLAPEVAGVIDARYPADEARGFAPGDLRGAFTITWPAR